jgi:hypothetical protein
VYIPPAKVPAFHALPVNMEKPPPTTTPLFEFVHRDSGRRAFSIDPNWSAAGYEMQSRPVCLVWK